MNYKLLLSVLLFVLCTTGARAQKFTDTELLSGNETLEKYGMDTTDNWWAITQPFSERYRLVVNGTASDVYEQLEPPVFSPDGDSWAAVGIKDSQWHILVNGGEIPLLYNFVEEVSFSTDSRILSLVGYRGDEGWIAGYEIENDEGTGKVHLKEVGTPLPLVKKTGRYYTSNNGRRRAYVGERSGGKIVSVEGRESLVFDDIKPVGFWYDGSFLYGALIGGQWRLYRGEEEVIGGFSGFSEPAVNVPGTIAVFIGSYQTGSVVVLISDEYYDPRVGEKYEKVMNLTLHPTLAMYSYNAVDQAKPYVVYNGTRYAATFTSSPPKFSWSGDNLVYIICEIECSMSIDGRQYPLKTAYDLSRPFAVDPATNTFAYVSSASLAVRKYTSDYISAGMIVDEMSAVRYNRRSRAYEMLGRINQRLYMIRCLM